MRAMLGACLMICATSGIAVECGPTTSTKSLEAHLERIGQLRQNVSAHVAQLLKELEAVMPSAQTETAFARADKLYYQTEAIGSADLAGERLASTLSTALIVAQIRDSLRGSKDIATVNKFLSTLLVYVAKTASGLQQSINRYFTKITAPAAIHDVSKLRDAIGDIASQYERCSLPDAAKQR